MKVDDRRGFIKFLGVSFGVATLGTSEAFGKNSKEAANYVESPKNGEKCSNCFHFKKETSMCTIVEGKVLPKGWCKFYLSEDVRREG